MLFLDQPATTGFSYTVTTPGYIDKHSGNTIALPDEICPEYAEYCGTYNTYNVSLTANSTAPSVNNVWLALQGFMGAFPQYTKNGFYLATESYGGHYGQYRQYL